MAPKSKLTSEPDPTLTNLIAEVTSEREAIESLQSDYENDDNSHEMRGMYRTLNWVLEALVNKKEAILSPTDFACTLIYNSMRADVDWIKKNR